MVVFLTVFGFVRRNRYVYFFFIFIFAWNERNKYFGSFYDFDIFLTVVRMVRMALTIHAYRKNNRGVPIFSALHCYNVVVITMSNT